MQTVDLRDIAFENINDDYAWGNYIDFKVIIMRKNGYINVSKICDETGKLLGTWKRSKAAEELLEEISSSMQICIDDLLMIPNVGNELRGTYAHPDLVPHITAWISPKFAVKVARIVNSYIVAQEKAKIEAEKRLLELKNKDLTNENISLKDQLILMESRLNDKMNNIVSELKDAKQEVINELEDVKDKLDEAHEQNYILENKVDEALEETIIVRQKVQELLPPLITPKTKDITGTEMCIILKRNNPAAIYKYYIICAYRNTALNKANKMQTDNDMIEIFRTSSPNSKNLLKRIKEDEYLIGSKIDRRRRNVIPREVKKIETYINDINLIDQVITEEDFLNAIRRLDDVKEDIVHNI